MIVRLAILILLLLPLSVAAQPGRPQPAPVYAPDRLVIRLVEPAAETGKESTGARVSGTASALSQVLKHSRALGHSQPFSSPPSATRGTSQKAGAPHPLHSIYILKVPPGTHLEHLARELASLPGVLYAEPYQLPQPLLVPDDPEAVPGEAQDYLTPIQAYKAWDVETGNPDITIGILDTGVRYGHPDLAANMAFNNEDPPNGADDDTDGYTDNYRGWDFANEDNDPNDYGSVQHGTAVAGLATGVPDNGLGIAGTGYNTSFLPVKIYTDDTYEFNNGYEAIAYAADAGCAIINLSWGGPGRYSQFVQDIINYAVLDKDAVIIAAAGNTHGDIEFFPAAYDHVLSVGAVDTEDRKTDWATYHPSIDLVAPGKSNYTTYLDDSYARFWGSSFAAPLVSGTAALVRSRFPDMTALQVMEQLRISADDIYHLPENAPYTGLMGKGRLNMHRALTETRTPAVRAENIILSEPYGAYVFPGDSALLHAHFTNHLADASILRVHLSSLTEGVEVTQNFLRIGDLPQGSTFDSEGLPFAISLSPELENGTIVTLRLDYEGVNYKDFQLFRFQLVNDPIYIRNGQLGASFGKKGEIAYQEDWAGDGIRYNDNQVALHAGIIMADGTGKEADNLVNSFIDFSRNSDFSNLSNYRLYNNSLADPDVRYTWAEDSLWGLMIEQKVYADTSASDYPGYLLVEYRLTNRSGSLIPDFHFGMYADFNLEDADKNYIRSVDSLQLQYTAANNLMAGLALAGGGDWHPQALIIREGFQRVDVPTFFGREVKYDLLTRPAPTYQAGSPESGYDAGQIAGVRLGDIGAYESRKVTFVMAVAENPELLTGKVQEALAIYNRLEEQPPVTLTTNTCPSIPVSVTPPAGTNFRFYRDAAGTDFIMEGAAYTSAGLSGDTTLYYRQADSLWLGQVGAIDIHITRPAAGFLLSADTLYLDENGPAILELTNTSEEATSYRWDFGNDYYSINPHPAPLYDQTGTYTIRLEAIAGTGCSDTAEKTIVVVQRNPLPQVPTDFSLCPGENITLEATNTSSLNLYSTWPSDQPEASGPRLSTGAIPGDSIVYVTNTDGLYESNPVEVRIDVMEVDAAFTASPDTSLSYTGASARLYATEEANTYAWYLDGVYMGAGRQILIDLAGRSTVPIALEATNLSGCTDRREITYRLSPSTAPEVVEQTTCKGETLTIHPGGGELFAFYADQEGQTLIHKGSHLSMTQVQSDTTLYIAGIDSLLLSPLQAVQIHVISPVATFSYEADSLTSWGIRDLSFTPDNREAATYYWDFGDGSTSEDMAPIHFFELPGQYTVTLSVTDSLGCHSQYSEALSLSEITGLADKLPAGIRLLPNPARDMWLLDFGQSPSEEVSLTLVNSLGQVVQRHRARGRQTVTFQREGLPPGLYLLHIHSPAMEGSLRLVLE